MKALIVSLLFIILLSSFALSQECDSCGCATKPTYTSTEPATFIGGKLKPNRSDLNNTDPNNYFPILVVFVQFKNEIGDSTSTDFETWPARRAPNYLNSVIGPDRIALTNWWDSYNGYAISDFWHEFSRGKLHIRGQAVSVILPQDSAWYRQNGGAPKVNKDIYDALIAMQIDWPFYDKWTYISPGTFSYSRDERVDMIYLVYRIQARLGVPAESLRRTHDADQEIVNAKDSAKIENCGEAVPSGKIEIMKLVIIHNEHSVLNLSFSNF